MFGKFTSRFHDLKDQLDGSKLEILEGAAAACAKVATISGGASNDEINGAIKDIKEHPAMSKFSHSEISRVVLQMFEKAGDGGAVRQMRLDEEIEQAAAKCKGKDAQYIFAIAVDVAMKDKNVDDDERQCLNEIAKILGVQARGY